jgi:glycosyltransferase involved in cell wall biosynthesis
MQNNLKTAVTHDWLLEYAGAERVLEKILEITGKKTDVFTTVYDGKDFPFLNKHTVYESLIADLPFGRKKYRSYLPLMPFAVEQWDMSEYDLVISSSYAVAKGFISHPDQLHISYVHSPMRYAWDLQHQYLKEAGLDSNLKGWFAKYLLHRMRKWDVNTANQVDLFIANSRFIQRRIMKIYRRESVVVYPPVNIDGFKFQKKKSDYYLTVSRLVPYKKVALMVRAFNQMPSRKFVVIGGGPDIDRIRKLAKSNIEVLGYQNQNTMVKYMQNAKAFVYAAKEDFGIVPIEAQACGTPVIAFGKGGLAETVKNISHDGEITGVLYYNQGEKDLIEAVKCFEDNYRRFNPESIRKHAEYFNVDSFKSNLESIINKELERRFGK